MATSLSQCPCAVVDEGTPLHTLCTKLKKHTFRSCTLRLVLSQIGACMHAAAQLLRTGLITDNVSETDLSTKAPETI